jgi:CubicO group peptidase (beta-lactamase class C family)
VRILPVLALFACMLAPAGVRAAPRAVHANDIDAAVSAEVAKGFSGGVLIARKGSVIFDRAYGDSIGPDTSFWIASLAKQFVAAAVMRAAERGKLDLGDPITRFFPDAPADKRDITVRDLLAHTSGLAPGDSADNARDRDAAARAILAQPLAGPRGTFRYSNDNYQLAAAIAEAALEMPYREIMSEMWQPARLLYAGFAGEPAARAVARARGKTPERLLHKSWGAQGVVATPGDLYRWYAALRSGKVISAPGVEQMFRGVTPIQEGEAALGWFVGREAGGARYYFTRGNEDWGPNGLMYAWPDDDLVVIILTHAGDAPDGTPWSRAMLAKLLPMLR